MSCSGKMNWEYYSTKRGISKKLVYNRGILSFSIYIKNEILQFQLILKHTSIRNKSGEGNSKEIREKL